MLKGSWNQSTELAIAEQFKLLLKDYTVVGRLHLLRFGVFNAELSFKISHNSYSSVRQTQRCQQRARLNGYIQGTLLA